MSAFGLLPFGAWDSGWLRFRQPMTNQAKTEWIEPALEKQNSRTEHLASFRHTPYTAHLCDVLCMTTPMHRTHTSGPLGQTVPIHR